MMQFLDQLKLGWEVLSKIESEMHNRSSTEIERTPHPQGITPINWTVTPPTLQDLIDEIGNLPPNAIIIGACEDRSHLFLDLTDPRPGSILIVGDHQSGKTHLLQAILASAGKLNPPRRVRYGIITPAVSEMIYLAGQPHCYQAVSAASGEAGDLVLELADIVEQRRNGFQAGAAFILAIDDLAQSINKLGEEMIEQFCWLVRCGPEARIWTVASLNTEDLESMDTTMLEMFDTRLFGNINSSDIPEVLGNYPNTRPNELQKGQQFGILFGEEWIPFWVPVVEAPSKSIPRKIIHHQEVPHERRNALVRQ